MNSARDVRWAQMHLLILGGLAVAIFVLCGVMAKPRIDEEILIRRIRSGSVAERNRAAMELSRLGSIRALPQLWELLSITMDDIGITYAPAFKAIVAIGDGAVPFLKEKLKDESIRAVALRILVELGDKAEGAMPELTTLIDTSDVTEREMVMICINRIGKDPGKEVVDRLSMLLRAEQESAVTRVNILQLFKKIRPDSEQVVKALVEILQGGKPDLKVMAILALEEYGPAGKAAVSTLKELMRQDESEEVRNAAEKAVKSIESE